MTAILPFASPQSPGPPMPHSAIGPATSPRAACWNGVPATRTPAPAATLLGTLPGNTVESTSTPGAITPKVPPPLENHAVVRSAAMAPTDSTDAYDAG